MQCLRITEREKTWEVYRIPYEPVDSNMYFIPFGETGIVFDPNENDELLTLFQRHGTRRVRIVLTHEHYDHTSGTLWLQSRIDSVLFCHQACAEAISKKRGNDPKLVAFVLAARDAMDGGHRYDDFKVAFTEYELHADETFDGNTGMVGEKFRLACFSTPGHSPGSAVYILDEKFVFTGDSLIRDTPVILRFPESDRSLYEKVTLPFLKSLDKNLLVFPGHGEPFRLEEAKYL